MDMKPKVYVTRRLPQEGMDMLEGGCEVGFNPHDRGMTREELMACVKDADGLVTLLSDSIDAEVMDAGPKLKVIANYAVGFNNINIAAATERGIAVTNTPGVLTETTADLAWALLMATARRIVESDRFMRSGRFQGWAPMLYLGHDIYDKTLGVVGFGRIGQAVARRALGFNMKVLYSGRQRAPEEIERDCNASFCQLETLLQESDFVSLHVPLTESTHHLIGAAQFDVMKESAILINTARGPVVDEKALVWALKTGKIAGAGLDVYEHEPDFEPELAEMDNVVMVPHIGSASVATRTKMATMVARDAMDVLGGRMPAHLVNPEVWDRRRI